MDPKDLTSNRAGRLIHAPGGYTAFVPHPLPPKLEFVPALLAVLSAADRAVGQLAGLGSLLPNPYLLIRPFVAREAVLSSRIEGTLASLSDLFFFEAAPAEQPAVADVREVANYVRALEHALIPDRRLPMSLRLIRELHGILMAGVGGNYATPGEFRRTQNWIGSPGCTLNTATYVPPPPPEMLQSLDAFERFLVAPSTLPPLVWLALLHYQFEAIHPFLDGNGRIGRLLISVLICDHSLLPAPLLYLSAEFERRRTEYYDNLLAVTQRGEWERWVEFFLEGVVAQANDAVARAERLRLLREEYRRRLASSRASAKVLDLVDELFANPVITIPAAAERLGVTYQGAAFNVDRLVRVGILKPSARKRRPRAYFANEIISLLGDESPPSGSGHGGTP